MILLRIVHVITQNSYVCDSYITDKKSLYAGGGMHPPSSPLDPPLQLNVNWIAYANSILVKSAVIYFWKLMCMFTCILSSWVSVLSPSLSSPAFYTWQTTSHFFCELDKACYSPFRVDTAFVWGSMFHMSACCLSGNAISCYRHCDVENTMLISDYNVNWSVSGVWRCSTA